MCWLAVKISLVVEPGSLPFGLVWLGSLLIASCGQASRLADNCDNGGPAAISETARMEESADPHWWLNSGAYIYRSGGVARTVEGKLADQDPWRLLYAIANPVDSDNGYRPEQNLVRLILTGARASAIVGRRYSSMYCGSMSQRAQTANASNGVLLRHRYQDGNNLYYAGIRVDGYAVVKKKVRGQYHTVKSSAVYPGVYDRKTHPNLLPTGHWVGLRTVIADNTNGNVDIGVYLNDEPLGSGWTRVLQVEDNGSDGERL